MYNRDIKEKFIQIRVETTTHPEEMFRSIFSKCEIFEDKFEKDACLFYKDQILAFYKYLNYSSAQTYRNLNSIMKAYTQFCFENGISTDEQNHYDYIDNDDYNSCVNSKFVDNMLITEEDMEYYLAQLYNARDKFLMLSLYEFGTAKNYSDITGMKVSDIDEENGILHLKTRNVKVSPKWISIAHETDETLVYYLYNDSILHEKADLIPSEYIFKETTRARRSDDLAKSKRILHGFRVLRDYLGMPPEIKMKNIVTSGRIALIKRESKKLGMDPIVYTKKYKKQLDEQFGSFVVYAHFIEAYGEYLY